MELERVRQIITNWVNHFTLDCPYLGAHSLLANDCLFGELFTYLQLHESAGVKTQMSIPIQMTIIRVTVTIHKQVSCTSLPQHLQSQQYLVHCLHRRFCVPVQFAFWENRKEIEGNKTFSWQEFLLVSVEGKLIV